MKINILNIEKNANSEENEDQNNNLDNKDENSYYLPEYSPLNLS